MTKCRNCKHQESQHVFCAICQWAHCTEKGCQCHKYRVKPYIVSVLSKKEYVRQASNLLTAGLRTR